MYDGLRRIRISFLRPNCIFTGNARTDQLFSSIYKFEIKSNQVFLVCFLLASGQGGKGVCGSHTGRRNSFPLLVLE